MSDSSAFRSVDLPIVLQAGMGGGLAGAELAGAVSQAGGLGTVGMLPPDELERALAEARRLTDRPLAVNLLLPFARDAHWRAAERADVVVTFWGAPERRTDGCWLHQVGSVEEALAARDAGADAVIAQGVEAGGHVRGTEPALALLGRVRTAVGDELPVFSAGGVATRGDVRERLAAGAAGVVVGTRFLMTRESGAHPAYLARLVEAQETVVTELFGLGWPARQRVVRNAATERWLRGGDRGPGWVRALHAATAPALSRLPMSLQGRVAPLQRAGLPFFGPFGPTADLPAALVDAAALYAGACVARITDILPAADVVRELTP
jgi:NAD(P)H-dependent flavin oxidoreductase YrpB (nitropropane dioxygenase family)